MLFENQSINMLEDITKEEMIILLDELRNYIKVKDRPRAFDIIITAMEVCRGERRLK